VARSLRRFVQNCTKYMPDNDQENWGRYLGLGLEMAVGVGLGLAVGYWLDKKYGWSPVATLVGAMIGLAGGLYLVIKDALKMNK
jgi:F0F1-type ATP synthase assembly protein I